MSTDGWPKIQDGTDFDGKQLLALVRSGKSPFCPLWDVNLLLQEIEDNLGTQVIDIPFVYRGSNNYGFHIELSNRPTILARLARSDVNMPNFEGFPIEWQASEARFEAEVYELLHSEPNIRVSRLLYHRAPVLRDGPKLEVPKDITGRRLFIFEKSEGDNNVWWDLTAEAKAHLLIQSSHIRASLFGFTLPLGFASAWFLDRLFEQKPKSIPVPVAPTREFCFALFTSKIEATIGNIGDMIGWESDNEFVGPIAAAAKQSLLRVIPHIIPVDDDQASLYRLVLDHGDFGIHNMSIAIDEKCMPCITSLFDWETGCIVPAILSDPLMAVQVDLVMDENAEPSFTRLPDVVTHEDHLQYSKWSRQYFRALFKHAPSYESAIRAGKDARHLWFALRDWRGANPERYFGDLGTWAENRMEELNSVSLPNADFHPRSRSLQ